MSSYTFEKTKVTIPPKTLVWIPLYAIHHDPKIYSDPEAFIPERFNGDVVRHPMHYLPFGDGPRNCIGNINYKILSLVPSSIITFILSFDKNQSINFQYVDFDGIKLCFFLNI